MDAPIIIHSVIDFLIVLIIIFGIFRGYTQGFIVQTISLFALVAGIYISVNLSMAFYDSIVDKSNVPLRNLPVITFSILFAAVVFFSNWIGVYVKKMVQPVKLNVYARIFGAVIGAVKYLFIASIILLFLQRLDDSFDLVEEEPNTTAGKEGGIRSKLFGPVIKFAPMIIPRLNFEITQPRAMEYEDFTEEPKEYEELPLE